MTGSYKADWLHLAELKGYVNVTYLLWNVNKEKW